MAKLRPSTKTRITKLFKQDTDLPEIRKLLKFEGFTVSTVQIKAVLRKYFIKYCDNLWANAVKLTAGNLCIIDRTANTLNAHHLIGRKNFKFRWDIDNGVCLGAYRHMLDGDMAAHGSTSATQEFASWMIAHRLGQWATFQGRRNDNEKITVDVYFLLETAKRLESELARLKSQPKVDLLAREKV